MDPNQIMQHSFQQAWLMDDQQRQVNDQLLQQREYDQLYSSNEDNLKYQRPSVCKYCGAELSTGSLFCDNCKQKIQYNSLADQMPILTERQPEEPEEKNDSKKKLDLFITISGLCISLLLFTIGADLGTPIFHIVGLIIILVIFFSRRKT